MAKITLYHNPISPISRSALIYLEQNKFQVTVIRYLENPISPGKIKSIIKKLGLPGRSIINKELLINYNLPESYLSMSTDDQIAQLIAQYPKLLINPILVVNNQAIIAKTTAAMDGILPIRTYEFANKFIPLSYN